MKDVWKRRRERGGEGRERTGRDVERREEKETNALLGNGTGRDGKGRLRIEDGKEGMGGGKAVNGKKSVSGEEKEMKKREEIEDSRKKEDEREGRK